MPAKQTLDRDTAVIVPIRSFAGALSRLRGVLDAPRCRELMMLMAGRVVAAADGLAVYVASDDAEVGEWAERLAATVIRVGRPGLSAAVTATTERAASDGFERVVVAHADLALAESLRPAVGPGLTIAPDRRRDGTNVLCVPTSAGFRFAYGIGSFARHVTHAREIGLAVNIVDDARLAVDIDNPEDLLELPESDRLALGLTPSRHRDKPDPDPQSERHLDKPDPDPQSERRRGGSRRAVPDPATSR